MIRVEWNSPANNEHRSQVMTDEQAAQWWEMAGQPVRETARFSEAPHEGERSGRVNPK